MKIDASTLPNTFNPSPGYVLLEILPNEEHESLTTEIKEEATPQRGKVLMVGDDTYYETGQEMKCPAKIGQTVIHSGYGWERFRYKGKQFTLCPFSKILSSYDSEDN